MTTELKIPNVGESITEVQIGQWLRKEGDRVEKDQPIVELETDKATVELPSPAAGVIEKLLKQPGDKAAVDEAIALIAESSAGAEDDGVKGRKGEGERKQETPGVKKEGVSGRVGEGEKEERDTGTRGRRDAGSEDACPV